MLLRRSVYQVITDADEREIERIYRMAFEMRLRLPAHLTETWLMGGRKYYPECHEAAHAFAEIAGIAAIDGEHAVLTKTEPTDDGIEFSAHFTSVLHSWNEFSVPSGKRFILDLLPEDHSSVFPVLLPAPNPAYWIPKDRRRTQALKEIQLPRMQHRIANLKAAMRNTLQP